MSTSYLFYLVLIKCCFFNNAHINTGYFCDFKCGRDHTVCYRAPCETSFSYCSEPTAVSPLSNAERRKILNLHNAIRSKVATANSTDKLPSASNMMAMSYDIELEFVAQCWTNACKIENDICRVTSAFENVGQNFFYFQDALDNPVEDILSEIFNVWIAEKYWISVQVLEKYKVSYIYGNFSQIIWANTTSFGCGRTEFGGGVFIVCNYGYGGNIEGMPIYLMGKPCSKCPANVTCNSDYPGLCGNIFIEDEWLQPFSITESANIISEFVLTRFVFVLLINLNLYCFL